MGRGMQVDDNRIRVVTREVRKPRTWRERFAQLLCILPGSIDAILYNIREHSRTVYARRSFPDVQFGPLAYATSDCEIEPPCRIEGNSRLVHTQMGRHSYCLNGCFFAFAKIGKFCSIGEGVIIGTWLHPTQLVSTFPGFYSSNRHTINFRLDDNIEEIRYVNVGNDVWIGHRAIILGGITVGDGAIIGAGAVVTRNVEPYAVVAGVPARSVRKRFSQTKIDRLLELGWWNYDDDTLRRNASLFGEANPDALIAGFVK